jgi:glycosyltransferase involved in cell wall biosynthesis
MVLESLLIFSGITGMAAALLNLVGANLYDIQALKQQRLQRLHPYSRQYRRRPLVTVLIYTHNAERTIEDCLNSLVKSSYRHTQIIVADNASADATKMLVRNFMAEHPKLKIKLYARRSFSAKNQVLKNAHKLYSKGELIFLLNANVQLTDNAIKQAVGRFNIEPTLDILTINQRRLPALRAAALLQDFDLMLNSRARKANSFFNADYFANLQPASVYTNSALTRLLKMPQITSALLQLGDKTLRQNYAADVIAYIPAATLRQLIGSYLMQKRNQLSALLGSYRLLINKQNPDHSVFLVWLRYPLSILFATASLIAPVVTAYFIYLAFSLRQPAFLMVLWSAVGLFLIYTVLEDDWLKLFQKAKYICLIPLTYSWLFALAILQYFVPAVTFIYKVRSRPLNSSVA